MKATYTRDKRTQKWGLRLMDLEGKDPALLEGCQVEVERKSGPSDLATIDKITWVGGDRKTGAPVALATIQDTNTQLATMERNVLTALDRIAAALEALLALKEG